MTLPRFRPLKPPSFSPLRIKKRRIITKKRRPPVEDVDDSIGEDIIRPSRKRKEGETDIFDRLVG